MLTLALLLAAQAAPAPARPGGYAVPPPPPPPRTAAPVRPRAPLASYFSPDDYPAEALRNGEQGIVSYRLHVGPMGRVTRCVVTGSSGSAVLDAAACRILAERARFAPARDRRGRPTADIFSGRIRWELPPPEPPPEAEPAANPGR